MAYIVKNKKGGKEYLSLYEKIGGKATLIRYLGEARLFTPEQLQKIKEYPTRTTIATLRPGITVDLKAAVVEKLPAKDYVATYTKKDGTQFQKTQKVTTAFIDDGTGKCSVTLWGFDTDRFNAGDTIEIVDGWVRENKYVDAQGRAVVEVRIVEGKTGFFKKARR